MCLCCPRSQLQHTAVMAAQVTLRARSSSYLDPPLSRDGRSDRGVAQAQAPAKVGAISFLVLPRRLLTFTTEVQDLLCRTGHPDAGGRRQVSVQGQTCSRAQEDLGVGGRDAKKASPIRHPWGADPVIASLSSWVAVVLRPVAHSLEGD